MKRRRISDGRVCGKCEGRRGSLSELPGSSRTWVDSLGVGVRKRKMSWEDGEREEVESEQGCVGDERERRKSLGKVMVGGEREVDCPVRKRRVKKVTITQPH
jgi:hypothetical protein